MDRLRASQHLGLLAAVLSAAAFATSGPFGKAVQETGWSSGAVVLLRVSGASLILLPAALLAVRGRLHLVRRDLVAIVAYGALAVAGCQTTYFLALQSLDVGVALLLEYSGILLVVVFVAVRRRALPNRLTGFGVLVSVLGLALVLDVTGQSPPAPIGVFWGAMAALGLATYFVIAARPTALPPVALAGFGMTAGAVTLAVLGLVGILPMHFESTDITVAGARLPWWVGIAELAVVAAAAAYLLGVVGARRLGSTVASFVGLTEVLFAIVFAWLLLDELPGLLQLVGGVALLGGVVAVKVGETRQGRHESDASDSPAGQLQVV